MEQFDTEVKLMELVVCSLLYAAEPSFSFCDHYEDDEYYSTLVALKESNPEIFNRIDLKNIELLYDESSAESALVSNIKQLLGDKLKVVDMRE
jgi:hypothetical protein